MPKHRAHKMTGKGFMDFIKGVGNFIKDNKLISTGLSLIPGQYGQMGSRIAGAVGLGRRRKKGKKKMHGGKMVLNGQMR